MVADPSLARRVVEGVLLAAARGGAEVRVTGSRKGRVARFRVEGAPATEEDLADPRRGDPGDTRGAALALPVARRACVLLGGAIRAEDGAWVLELAGPGDAPPAELARRSLDRARSLRYKSALSNRFLHVLPGRSSRGGPMRGRTWLLVSWVARSA